MAIENTFFIFLECIKGLINIDKPFFFSALSVV